MLVYILICNYLHTTGEFNACVWLILDEKFSLSYGESIIFFSWQPCRPSAHPTNYKVQLYSVVEPPPLVCVNALLTVLKSIVISYSARGTNGFVRRRSI